jgi:high affinity Mn2+ porin
MIKILWMMLFTGTGIIAWAQDSSNTNLPGKKFSLHAQATTIPQYHFDFKAPYSGNNSMLPSENVKASLTATIFAVYHPFKHTYFVFNPELAGGKGLSKTLGVAGFPNGEVYRVGDPEPKPFIARLYVEQRFPLSKRTEQVGDDENQVQETTAKDYISISAGKFSLTDFFDNSSVSHDPRTQFLNWSLFGSGAWDYPANTRGYNFAAVLQVLYHDWAFRYANTFMPTTANGPNLEWKGTDAMGQVWEIEKQKIFKRDNDVHNVNFHVGVFWNRADMGNYRTSINNAAAESKTPDITDSRQLGRAKWGFYDVFETNQGPIHFTIKSSWNDGKNETWAFTEIDRSFVLGYRVDGDLWKRKKDNAGIAYVKNDISNDHKEYLEKGGYGFLIGDGQLNYGSENIVELFYSFNCFKYFYLSPDYQFVLHPGYNKDRGPVHFVALRIHAEF